MSKKDMINVNGTTDPFYRYVMPKVEIKVEGTNKMIRTYIININNIAECLNRTAEYINTYLGQELSVNQCYDKQTERFYVSGKYDQHKIQSVLQKMINSFILCKKCGNPETVNNIVGKKKNLSINLICRSCGHTIELNNTDKFVKYIILHEPNIDNKNSEDGIKDISDGKNCISNDEGICKVNIVNIVNSNDNKSIKDDKYNDDCYGNDDNGDGNGDGVNGDGDGDSDNDSINLDNI
jgi:translation initiation factor 2 subunit 2